MWLLSSALGVVCGGKSTLRSQKGVAGGSSSPNSSSHCHGEPGSPIPAQCLLPHEAVLGWPYLDWGWEGPQGQWEGQNYQWGWPGRGIALGIWLWAWVRFRLSSLGAREKRAGAAGGPEVHNVLLKKVRLTLASSIPLGLMRVSAYSSLSQVSLQAGPAQFSLSVPLLFSDGQHPNNKYTINSAPGPDWDFKSHINPHQSSLVRIDLHWGMGENPCIPHGPQALGSI